MVQWKLKKSRISFQVQFLVAYLSTYLVHTPTYLPNQFTIQKVNGVWKVACGGVPPKRLREISTPPPSSLDNYNLILA